MSAIKKILKSNFINKILCYIAYLYINFIYLSSKWQIKGYENIEYFIKNNKSFILAFWHGRLFMMAKSVPKTAKVNIIISNHNDGKFIANVMRFFKFDIISGSTSKGGVAVIKKSIAVLKENQILAITPDGPRGPAMKYQGNMIGLAQKTNVPIIPVTFSVRKAKIFNSWDSFILPKPFNKGVFIYAKPIYVKKNFNEAELKNAGKLFENSLNEITKQADDFINLNQVKGK